jgi:hypothetical protein
LEFAKQNHFDNIKKTRRWSRTEERLEIAKAKENYWKEFREVREEDTKMEEDERQAWRNVKLGMDTFEEEIEDQNKPRGAQGGKEDKGSMSVSQSVRKKSTTPHLYRGVLCTMILWLWE